MRPIKSIWTLVSDLSQQTQTSRRGFTIVFQFRRQRSLDHWAEKSSSAFRRQWKGINLPVTRKSSTIYWWYDYVRRTMGHERVSCLSDESDSDLIAAQEASSPLKRATTKKLCKKCGECCHGCYRHHPVSPLATLSVMCRLSLLIPHMLPRDLIRR